MRSIIGLGVRCIGVVYTCVVYTCVLYTHVGLLYTCGYTHTSAIGVVHMCGIHVSYTYVCARYGRSVQI